MNFTGLVAAFVAFALIFLQADYELSFDKCHPTADRVFRADKKGDESLFRGLLPGYALQSTPERDKTWETTKNRDNDESQPIPVITLNQSQLVSGTDSNLSQPKSGNDIL